MKDQYRRSVHFSSSAPLRIFFWHSMANQSYLEYSANRSLSVENNLPHEYDYGKFFLSFLVIASTLLGNSVIIFSYCQNYKMRTATNTMVLNHCLADTFLVLSDIAFYVTPAYIPSLMDGDVFCTLSAFFDSLFKAASILSMCGIALDRYVHLVRNSRKRMSKERTMVVITWCWLQSAVVATPWNKLARLEKIVNKEALCHTLPRLFEAGLPLKALSVFCKMVSVLLPLLGICYVSYRVFSTVRRRRKVKTHEGSLQVARRVPSESFVTRAHARSPITAIILLLVYILCMTPFFVAIVWTMFPKTRVLAPGTAFAVYFLFRLKGSLLPILYILRNRFVLSYLHKLVCCSFAKKTGIAEYSNAFVTNNLGGRAEWNWVSPRQARGGNGFNRRGVRQESRVFYGVKTLTVTFDFTDLKRARGNSRV